MNKIVLAFDSFKGSLSSSDIAAIFADEWLTVFPRCSVVQLPVADGGEGMAMALTEATGGRRIDVMVHDPLMRLTGAQLWLFGKWEYGLY